MADVDTTSWVVLVGAQNEAFGCASKSAGLNVALAPGGKPLTARVTVWGQDGQRAVTV